MSLVANLIGQSTRLAERGLVPDPILRAAIRQLVRTRAADERRTATTTAAFARQMQALPIAVETDAANRQHYEVAPAFFERVLGPRLKYSCAEFAEDVEELSHAEDAMLARSCARAGLDDGMTVLDLGCGWGSMSTWIAEHYPHCNILAVSNSHTHRIFILDRCAKRGFDRVEVITANAATLDLAGGCFDRVISVEMFEHMRNWPALYERISRWLVPDGRFFQHVFCHARHPYFFEDEGSADWMARHFFSGGIMPSYDLPQLLDAALEIEDRWRVDGRHYARTSRAWLERLDAQHGPLLQILGDHPDGPEIALQRWRMFFMACEELFGFRRGSEWFVGHYLLRRREA
jgi:cyclopropane-fatty-acyl-phospholipid synthase